MEEADALAELLLEVRHEPVEAGVLREDERLVPGRHELEQLEQPVELAGAAVQRLAGGDHHLRVVADLLQLAEHRQHGAAPAEAVVVRLDAREPAVDRRAIQARLLDGEPAVVLGDRDRRQLELDLGRVLRPPEDERLDDRAQPLQRLGVPERLDRLGERALEPVAGAEQARVDDVHDRPQLAEPVLDRGAGHRQLPASRKPPERTRPLRRRVLDVLRLVQQQPVPGDEGKRVDIPGCDVVRGDDDVVRVRGTGERRAGEPSGAVVEMDAQGWCEAARSPLPIA